MNLTPPSEAAQLAALRELAGELPFASSEQVGLQQSPATLLPSSHCSSASSVPLPHLPDSSSTTTP